VTPSAATTATAQPANSLNSKSVEPASSKKPTAVNGDTTTTKSSLTTTASSPEPASQLQTLPVTTEASVGKQYRNKLVACRPTCHTRTTQCTPMVCDASTQLDLDEIKLSHTIVPLPVPINVPLPMPMYQAPLPVPFLIPVPIPVPVFIPTTKRTFDRIQRKIKVAFHYQITHFCFRSDCARSELNILILKSE
jgi:hypothetical protein